MGAGAAPNSEPLPRAAPAAGRRHRGARNHPPRPRGGHPAPAEKLTLRAAAGGAERARRVYGAERAAAAAARASLTRPPAARPPSRPASAARERSPGAAAAAERVRTCSVPPPSPRGTYHRGGGREGGKRRGEHGEIGGRAGCYQEDELKIGAAEKNSWSLKGQRRPRSPQAPGRGCLPGAGADLPPRRSCPRCRRRGTETGAMPARAAPGSCPCGYAGMRLLPPKRAGLHGARRGCGGGGLLGAPDGAAAGLCPPLASAPGPSPQRRAPRLRAGPVTPAPGWAVFTSGPGRLPQSGPFTSGPGHPVKRQFQKSGLESAGEDAKRYFHAVCLRRRLHPALRCSVVWTRLEEKQTRTSLLSSEAQRSQMRM